MKTVILGAKGMLGKDLGRVFSDWNPILLDKKKLDITDERAVKIKFTELKPEIVINAAAYTDVDGCETNKDLAMRVNGEAPGFLAQAAKDVGAVFVHYSTDYVFRGDKKEGYREDDQPRPTSERVEAGKPDNPINAYGESKLLGEQAVQKVGESYYIIRTSWLLGLHGPNFVDTILRLAREKDELKVVNDQHGKPTFSLDLARRTKELLEGSYDFGIYHITNEPAATWYEFAKEVLKENTKENSRIFPCSSSEFSRPAKRPKYSILLNTKLPLSRSWHEALEEYLFARKG